MLAAMLGASLLVGTGCKGVPDGTAVGDAAAVGDASTAPGSCDPDPLRTNLAPLWNGLSVDIDDCPILEFTAKYNEPDAMIFKAIIYVESRFQYDAVGCTGNAGCCPARGWTAAECGCLGSMQTGPWCNSSNLPAWVRGEQWARLAAERARGHGDEPQRRGLAQLGLQPRGQHRAWHRRHRLQPRAGEGGLPGLHRGPVHDDGRRQLQLLRQHAELHGLQLRLRHRGGRRVQHLLDRRRLAGPSLRDSVDAVASGLQLGLQQRVLAHIFVCFLAYVMCKTLKRWHKRAGLGNSPRTILDELSTIQSTDVILPIASDPIRELRIRCVVRPDKASSHLLERLGLRLPERLRPATSATGM